MMNTIIWHQKENKELTQAEIYHIAELKNQHWPYGIESQLKWMNENIKTDDLHLMGYDETNNILLAYATIVTLEVEIDRSVNRHFGIGGVCVNKAIEHFGYGKQLIYHVNDFFLITKQMGFLLCKDELVGFYSKCGWQKLIFDEAIVANKPFLHNIMTIHNSISCKSIHIDRNF